MRLFRGRIWLLVVLILGLSACESAPSAHTSPSVQQSPAAKVAPSADPERCARLAKRGFIPCPPTPDQMPLPPTTIRNATNGAITDATARQWGRAFQLTEAYYRWAMQNGARSALTAGGIADPGASGELFAPDLKDLDDAKAESGILVDHPPTLTMSQLVVIPADLQDRIRKQSLTPMPYGFSIQLKGPASRTVRGPGGNERLLWSVDAQQSQLLLVWGEFKVDPDLGPIWYEYGLYGCDGVVRVVCQP